MYVCYLPFKYGFLEKHPLKTVNLFKKFNNSLIKLVKFKQNIDCIN